MTRVRWDKFENKKVMAEFHRLKMSGEYGSQQVILKKAQLVLPEQRRLTCNTSTACRFNKLYQLAVQNNHVPTPEQAVPVEEKLKDPPEIIVVRQEVIVKEQPDYGKIPTIALCSLLMERLANLEEAEAKWTGMVAVFEQKRKQEAEYHRKLDTRPAAEQPKEEPLRICVIGLLPGQINEVEGRIAGIARPLKMRFYDSQNEGQEISDYHNHIIVTRFCHHAWTEKARAKYPAECVHFVDGGIQSVVQKIYDLSSRKTVTATNGNGIPKALSL